MSKADATREVTLRRWTAPRFATVDAASLVAAEGVHTSKLDDAAFYAMLDNLIADTCEVAGKPNTYKRAGQ